MHCARFSLEADTRKMGVFVIETLVEALLLKIVWHMANIVWHMANIVWHMANIVWHVTNIVWHMANIVWHVANIVWHMANIVWHMANIVWRMANIVWHVTNIVWHMANIVWHIFVYFCYDILQFIVHDFLFLGEFVKLRKATNSFVMSCHVMSARLSVSVEQLRYHWTDIR